MSANKQINIHVAGLTSQPDVFHVTTDRIRAAFSRFNLRNDSDRFTERGIEHSAAEMQNSHAVTRSLFYVYETTPDVKPTSLSLDGGPVQDGCTTHTDIAMSWSWDLDSFDAHIRQTDILIGWRFPTNDLRSRAPSLRWITLTGAGTEHLQPYSWTWRGLAITNNSGVHGKKAAEFAGTAVLAMAHGLPFLAASQAASRWEKRFTTRIEGGTAMVIGLGGMGMPTARWLKRKLNMRVIGINRSGRPCRWVDEVAPVTDIDRYLPEADTVIVMAPLTMETRNLLDRQRIASLKPGATLLNMGRARVVDYDAVVAYLRNGHLGGAVLDVFDPEPLPASSKLWKTPGLLISPHCSSDDAKHYMADTLDMFTANLVRFMQGRPLNNRIRTRLGY